MISKCCQDEHHLGNIINFLNSKKEAINIQWGYEHVKKHSKAIIGKEDDGQKLNVQMMPYSDLLITENDDRNKAYSCCLECSLGFIDYSKQPDCNYKHVFVYQDDVTKFTILKPLKEKERDEISHCLLEIFSLIGVPAKIYTREKSLVKSIFNKHIRNFSKNFLTKIKQPKNRSFEETECCRIDEKIKEWMESTLSTEWSQGLYFVQFQNNCYFNETINAAPFYALLKPSYTYSRRKYTRYLFRKKDHDETVDPYFLKHPACNSNREREGTIQFSEKSSIHKMKEKGFSSRFSRFHLEKVNGTNILQNDHLTSRDCLKMFTNDNGMEMLYVKLLENEYQPDMGRNDCKLANITNLEHGRATETLDEYRPSNKYHEKVCGDNNKYEIIEESYDSLKNERGRVKEGKEILENKIPSLNKVPNNLRRELSKEKEKNECEQNVSSVEQIHDLVNVLENDYFEQPNPVKGYKTESNQGSSLTEYLNNHCDSINLSEEALESNNKRKQNTGNDRLSIPKNSTCHVFRLFDDQHINVVTKKLEQSDSKFGIGKDLNKKHNGYDYNDICPTKFDIEILSRNGNSKIDSKLIYGNTSKIDRHECAENGHLTLKKNNHLTLKENNHLTLKKNNQLILKENNIKANSVRFSHNCCGKHQVCLICKKKKRHKVGPNSLNKTSFAIGTSVRVRVPVTERLRGYPNYILATVIDEKDRMYKLATPKGVLKEMFKRDQLLPCNTSMSDN